jgi:hypothetical protein
VGVKNEGEYLHTQMREWGCAGDGEGISNFKKLFLCPARLKMVVGVGFCGGETAKVRIYSDEEVGV